MLHRKLSAEMLLIHWCAGYLRR